MCKLIRSEQILYNLTLVNCQNSDSITQFDSLLRKHIALDNNCLIYHFIISTYCCLWFTHTWLDYYYYYFFFLFLLLLLHHNYITILLLLLHIIVYKKIICTISCYIVRLEVQYVILLGEHKMEKTVLSMCACMCDMLRNISSYVQSAGAHACILQNARKN